MRERERKTTFVAAINRYLLLFWFGEWRVLHGESKITEHATIICFYLLFDITLTIKCDGSHLGFLGANFGAGLWTRPDRT